MLHDFFDEEPPQKKRFSRKLNFDAPSFRGLSEIQESPSSSKSNSEPVLPASWVIENDDLEKRLKTLREELDRRSSRTFGIAAPDPSSPLRTEFRKMLMAVNIVNEICAHQEKQKEWMENITKMSTQDEENLQKRRVVLESTIENLRNQLMKLNATISKNTQKAVKTIIEIREDDGMTEEDAIADDDYQKYTKISRLCEVALTSFDEVLRKTKQMKHEIAILNRKAKARQKLCLATAASPKIHNITQLLKSLPVEALRQIEEICE